ncbi:hypothetical protein CKO20_04630 [Rhodocyclus tenuis]|nr:hypothetical protein [Rhodocyclus tenuis]
MAIQTPPPEKSSAWRIVGWVSFAVAVALFMFANSLSGMRWLGVVTLVGAAIQIIQQRITYGWEGREPSGYITGIPAVLLGLVLGALGLAMLARPELMLALFGWHSA